MLVNIVLLSRDEIYFSGGSQLTLASDTQTLCARLENKIQNLAKLGSHLEQENQGTVCHPL